MGKVVLARKEGKIVAYYDDSLNFGDDGMKNAVCAGGVVSEMRRRKISPDEVAEVSQGTLKMWLYCNSYVVELCCPGDVSVFGNGAYLNTYSPQEIADDVIRDMEVDVAILGEMEIERN